MRTNYQKIVKAEMALRGIAQLSNDDVIKIIEDLDSETQWDLGSIHGIYQAADWQLQGRFKSDGFRKRVCQWVEKREEMSAITDVTVLIELARSLISEKDVVVELVREQVNRYYVIERRYPKRDRRDPDCDCWFSIDYFLNELQYACVHPSVASERGIRGRFQRKYQRIRDTIEELRYMLDALREELTKLKEDNDRKERRQDEADKRERSWDNYTPPRMTNRERYALDSSLSRADAVRDAHACGQGPSDPDPWSND